jgi:hypothetical protein
MAAVWLKDIRKTALLAGIVSVLSLAMPLYAALQSTSALNADYGVWWITPAMVLPLLVALALPALYFALYLDAGKLLLTPRLRAMSLAGALAVGICAAFKLPGWVNAFAPRMGASVLAPGGEPWTLGHVFPLILAVLSSIVPILPLIALAASPEESSTRVSASRPLRLIAKIGAILWGLWVGFLIVRVVLTPSTYGQLCIFSSQIQQIQQIHRTPPRLWELVSEASRDLLGQFGFFVAPFVVWRSIENAAIVIRADPNWP